MPKDSASSITLNLAEGYGRNGRKDQKNFFRIAYASLCECRAVFDLHELVEAEKQADSLGAMIYCLIRAKQ